MALMVQVRTAGYDGLTLEVDRADAMQVEVAWAWGDRTLSFRARAVCAVGKHNFGDTEHGFWVEDIVAIDRGEGWEK